MWAGLIVLCVAGTTPESLDEGVCIKYISPPFESEEQCHVSLMRALYSEEMYAMLNMPGPDLEVVEAKCNLTL